MKNVLVVIEVARDPSSLEKYDVMKKEVMKSSCVEEILGAGFFIKGSDAFKIAVSLLSMGMKYNLHMRAFEVESELF